jgi:hypothetical protein
MWWSGDEIKGDEWCKDGKGEGVRRIEREGLE